MEVNAMIESCLVTCTSYTVLWYSLQLPVALVPYVTDIPNKNLLFISIKCQSHHCHLENKLFITDSTNNF